MAVGRETGSLGDSHSRCVLEGQWRAGLPGWAVGGSDRRQGHSTGTVGHTHCTSAS